MRLQRWRWPNRMIWHILLTSSVILCTEIIWISMATDISTWNRCTNNAIHAARTPRAKTRRESNENLVSNHISFISNFCSRTKKKLQISRCCARMLSPGTIFLWAYKLSLCSLSSIVTIWYDCETEWRSTIAPKRQKNPRGLKTKSWPFIIRIMYQGINVSITKMEWPHGRKRVSSGQKASG